MTTYIVDANLIVLLVVGSYNIDLIGGRHKRCREFDARDFAILDDLLSTADAVVCTPHAMAEASNLVPLIGDPLRSALTIHFGKLVPSFSEIYAPSANAVVDNDYWRLGLTNATLLSGSNDHEILTTDLDLYLAALGRGRKATNFVALRDSIAPH